MSSFGLSSPSDPLKLLPQQATGVNCTILSDLVQLKARQRDVRLLHPEDMMQNDVLVRPPLRAKKPLFFKLSDGSLRARLSSRVDHNNKFCILLSICSELQQDMVYRGGV